MKIKVLALSFLCLACWTIASPGQTAVPEPGRAWSLAAVGDAIITRRMSLFDNDSDPGFKKMTEVIRGADAAAVNLELSLFRFSDFKGWPEVETGGGWVAGPPEAAMDLKGMGFLLFSRANNHTTDYGVEGMRVTDALLDELGISHAGSGENLGQASRPAYLDTRNGRVALISLATSFTPMSRAGASRPEIRGRPGLNALRVERKYLAGPSLFAALRASATAFGGSVPEDPKAAVRIFGATVAPAQENQVIVTLNAQDQERILNEVRNASKLADYVVVSAHSHDPGNSITIPPPWIVEFAKKCIDAGASAYIIHGPHQLRGIEIYRGKPIFYSLGNFVFQNETLDPAPSDWYETVNLPDTALASDLFDAFYKLPGFEWGSSNVWYESVVAVPSFSGGKLVDLKLYPIDLARTAPRSQRGTPRLADEETGRRIIERIARQSASFGTTIVYEKSLGIWRPGRAAQAVSK